MAKQNGKNSTATVINPDLQWQDEVSKSVKESGFDFSLIVAGAFVRGMREIGYKHTGTAMDELIDNALQADATDVSVVFGFEGNDDKKPASIAVIDNGHGMNEDMVRFL
jgi:hypothetical protein